MNENSQQKEVAPGKSEGAKKDYIFLNNGFVIVRGHHLVSQQTLAILSEVLKLDREGECFGVNSVVFRNDGRPGGMLGMAYPDTHSVAINLDEIWDLSCLILEEGEKHLSLTGLVWETLLMTLFHEINHIDACRVDEFRDNMDRDHKWADDVAEEWAKEIRTDMAKVFNIEPPAMADTPFFGVKFMELMTTKAEEEWVSNAAALTTNGIIYQDLENDERITTYREYVRGLVDPKMEDKSWDQGYSAIDFAFNLEDGSEKVIEEPKVDLKVPEVVEIAPAVVEAMEAAAGVEAAAGDTVIGFDENTKLADIPVATGEVGTTVVADEETSIQPSPEMMAAAAEDEQPVQKVDLALEVAGAAGSDQQQLFTPVQAAAGTKTADEIQHAAVMEAENSGEQAAVDAVAAEQNFTDTVELPDHILAEQAQLANAANATPQTFQPKTPLTPVNMQPAQIVAFMKDVYMRLYSNIFNKCGRILNNDQPFQNPGAVLDELSLADLIQQHNAQGLIVSYESLNELKRRAFEDFVGHVRGIVFAKSNPYGLPSYVLYLNLGGVVTKRSLVPQNPAKINTNSGMLSTTALEARSGSAIAWIMSDDPGNKFIAQIRNNIYQVL